MDSVMIYVFFAVIFLVLFAIILQQRSMFAALQESDTRRAEELAALRAELQRTDAENADRLLHQQLAMKESSDQRLDSLRDSMSLHMKQMRDNNDRQLAEIRVIVDEKLHESLEKRLGESFRLVSEQLEQVYKGLGEMQTLAGSVGDLKKVLGNIKTRGIWGEVQLGALLEQIMAPGQYQLNAAVNPDQPRNRVEYAIVLPGKDSGSVYLPIDAKFPLEDYQALLMAEEQGDEALRIEAGKALERRIREEARDVRDKYIAPPHTTDFAIIYLPVEGLYSELLKRPQLVEVLQRDYRVVLAGPTTIAALLNSLQMGFRSLAVEARSNEVWQLLAAVKGSFGDFAMLLDKTQKKLAEASHSIDDAARKTRLIEKRLNKVSVLEISQEENDRLLYEEN